MSIRRKFWPYLRLLLAWSQPRWSSSTDCRRQTNRTARSLISYTANTAASRTNSTSLRRISKVQNYLLAWKDQLTFALSSSWCRTRITSSYKARWSGTNSRTSSAWRSGQNTRATSPGDRSDPRRAPQLTLLLQSLETSRTGIPMHRRWWTGKLPATTMKFERHARPLQVILRTIRRKSPPVQPWREARRKANRRKKSPKPAPWTPFVTQLTWVRSNPPSTTKRNAKRLSLMTSRSWSMRIPQKNPIRQLNAGKRAVLATFRSPSLQTTSRAATRIQSSKTNARRYYYKQ